MSNIFLLDWMVIIGVCLLSVLVGIFFSKSGSKDGAKGFFTGNQNLPWWAIGFSNTATYSSNGAAFIMLILVSGLAYNWV